MYKYTLRQDIINHKGSFPKFSVLHVFIHSTTTQTLTQRLDAKIPLLICVHTLYNNTNINIKSYFQISKSFMCKYPLQQHKHIHKGYLPNSQSYMCTYHLQQHIPKHKCFVIKYQFVHNYIPSTTIKSLTLNHVAKMPSFTCVHTLYNNININKKAIFQNAHFYMYEYPLQ